MPNWAIDYVTVATTRGYMSVDPADGERLFRLRVHIPGFAWEIGATDDLGLLVDVIAAWRDGVALDVLAAEFEFLELEEFAGALDRGEPTSSQWADLLSSDDDSGDLLRRLHADEGLRTMFPTITHRAVRLRVDPMDWRSHHVLVYEVDTERYMTEGPGAPRAEVPAGDLIRHLRAALDEGQ
ncbi:hypothetical protein [Streptomyces sp. 4F14]|uniref:hypothetical protein n=1 Tax=Streptomyces sp. 4F14 TaxID=3394380 RepID=UPI003A8AC824